MFVAERDPPTLPQKNIKIRVKELFILWRPRRYAQRLHRGDRTTERRPQHAARLSFLTGSRPVPLATRHALSSLSWRYPDSSAARERT